MVLQSHFSQAEMYGGDSSGLYPTAILYDPHFGQRLGLPLSNRIVAPTKPVRTECVASRTNAASVRLTLLECVNQFASCHPDFATLLRYPRTLSALEPAAMVLAIRSDQPITSDLLGLSSPAGTISGLPSSRTR